MGRCGARELAGEAEEPEVERREVGRGRERHGWWGSIGSSSDAGWGEERCHGREREERKIKGKWPGT